MLDKLKDLDLRYEDLESQLGDPRVYGDAEKLRQVNRELKELLPVVETYRAYQAADGRGAAACSPGRCAECRDTPPGGGGAAP